MSGHCLVKLNSSHVFLTGGKTASSYIYSRTIGFIRQGDMGTPRYRHACTFHGDKVWVAGGTTGLVVGQGEFLNQINGQIKCLDSCFMFYQIKGFLKYLGFSQMSGVTFVPNQSLNQTGCKMISGLNYLIKYKHIEK